MRLGGALILAVLLLAGAARDAAAQRPAVIVTDPSARAFKAAIQRFTDQQAVPDAQRLTELRERIGAALVFSKVFAVIDPKAFLGPDETAGLDGVPPPVCPDWSQIGADALIEGTVVTEPRGMAVQFHVWDVVRCRRLKRKRYFGNPGDVDVIARRIADDVIEAFTGRHGMSSTEIAFVSDRSGRKEIYVMNSDGTDVRGATRNRSINAFPDWSPKGNEIIYTSYRLGGQPTLFLLTRGRRKPGQLLSTLDDSAPIYRGTFDPKGSRIAFVMSVNGAPELFTSRRDGRGLKRLTKHRAIDISPAWSPDGRRMAFVSDRSGAPQLYMMGSDGSNVRRLTYDGAYNTSPAWSPDGNWIAYESRVGGQFDIWIIDPAGTSSSPLVTHPRSDEGPTWSPDGRWLAFSSTRRGNADIYAVGIDGKNLRRLTKGAGNNTSPAWGPHPAAR
ncbi:MAG: PD40 domain-containing protein [Deltaproteobacteria bacterium]|nr:PD40 domain-containing protein [Deltaproteobacteria bacterium]